jgi:biopolymer transport protein ExbB
MKKFARVLAASVMLGLVSLSPAAAFAADPAPADAAAPAGTEEQAAQSSGGYSIWDVLCGGNTLTARIINFSIWLTIGGTSFAMVWLAADGVITVKREKIMPPALVDGVRKSLTEGNLENALTVCETNPSPLSNILMAGFANISEGYDVIQESVAKTTEMENEKLLQRINYLNLCGQLAPMLGLLGTVTGMMGAFSTLGSSGGGANAKMLAVNIAVALWTTAVGLIISIPAILALTFLKNHATRLFIETESTVLDLIKVLRTAEIE